MVFEKSIWNQHGVLWLEMARARRENLRYGLLLLRAASAESKSDSIDVKSYNLTALREAYDAKVEEDCLLVWSACCLFSADRDEPISMFWRATCAIDDMLRLQPVAHYTSQPLGHALVDSFGTQSFYIWKICGGHHTWLTRVQQQIAYFNNSFFSLHNCRECVVLHICFCNVTTGFIQCALVVLVVRTFRPHVVTALNVDALSLSLSFGFVRLLRRLA